LDLPASLRHGLDRELEKTPARVLAAAAEALSSRYRAGAGEDGTTPHLRSPGDVTAYAAFRLPATFGAIGAALGAVRERRPDWRPHAILDAGAGPGTALWAATALWPSLQEATAIERDDSMIALGRRLATDAGGEAPVRGAATWLRADLTSPWKTPSTAYDLVVAAYTLGEVAPRARAEVLSRLWAATTPDGVLLVAEPGTTEGFGVILAARTQVLSVGANVVAPCPHDRACPMGEGDWCHFAQRVARSKLHRQVKGGALAYEDEKYTYVALTRTGVGSPIAGRVLRHPQVRPGRITLELCAPDGLEKTTVTRADPRRWREARDITWGDALTLDPR